MRTTASATIIDSHLHPNDDGGGGDDEDGQRQQQVVSSRFVSLRFVACLSFSPLLPMPFVVCHERRLRPRERRQRRAKLRSDNLCFLTANMPMVRHCAPLATLAASAPATNQSQRRLCANGHLCQCDLRPLAQLEEESETGRCEPGEEFSRAQEENFGPKYGRGHLTR